MQSIEIKGEKQNLNLEHLSDWNKCYLYLLPEKTVMWLNRNGAVTVKHGYRTSTVSIRKPSLN